MTEATRRDLHRQVSARIRETVRLSIGERAAETLNAGGTVVLSGREADDAATAALEVVDEAALDRVRALHREHACGEGQCPVNETSGGCSGLQAGEDVNTHHGRICEECRRIWPCDTIRALDGGQP